MLYYCVIVFCYSCLKIENFSFKHLGGVAQIWDGFFYCLGPPKFLLQQTGTPIFAKCLVPWNLLVMRSSYIFLIHKHWTLDPIIRSFSWNPNSQISPWCGCTTHFVRIGDTDPCGWVVELLSASTVMLVASCHHLTHDILDKPWSQAFDSNTVYARVLLQSKLLTCIWVTSLGLLWNSNYKRIMTSNGVLMPPKNNK